MGAQLSADNPTLAWGTGPVRPFPRDRTLDQLVERQGALTPDATALIFEHGRKSLTYRELNDQANRWRRSLALAGIGQGDAVGLCLQRGPRLLTLLLGVLKAGAAYVPLDPTYPSRRLRQMIDQSGVALVVVDGESADRVASQSTPVWCIEEGMPRTAACGNGCPNRGAATSEDLAYILFTSGSTGMPKGVAMPHRSLVNLITWQVGCCHAPPGARTLQFAPLGFDVSFQEIFSTWSSGGALVVIEEQLRRDPNGLLQFIESLAIERVFLPVVMLRYLAEASQRRPCQLQLRQIITAGETLEITPAIEAFLRRVPQCRLTNHYGPTEPQVVTSYDVPPIDHAPVRRPPIGRPIPNVQVYLFDPSGQLVGPGDVGELHIGGEAVARGYIGRGELTDERFIADPFRPGHRLYRTGDFARWLADGQLQFLGRRDDQVKIRGHRVELGEVQTALEGLAGVLQAVVVAEEWPDGGRQMAAFVVAESADRSTSAEIRHGLAAALPAYMLPSRIVSVDRFPLTPSGKIDRPALRTIGRQADRSADSTSGPSASPTGVDRGPRDQLELRLLRVWKRVLRQPIEIDDDFFDRGGDSLRAMELLTALENELDRPVPLALLLDHPTVESLANCLQQWTQDQPWSPLVPIHRTGDRPPFFCVHPGGGNGLCYLPLALHMGEDQPVYALQAAGLDGRRQPVETVEAMAAEYVTAMRSVQPTGPYALGGWSFGGTVAYEMAHQLVEAGEAIRLLAVIDAGILYSFGVMRTIFPKHEFAMMDLRQLAIEAQVEQFRKRTAEAGLIPPRATSQQAERIYRVFLANTKAMMDYRPR
ncbi:MAG: amino acid adenylation domain-containing protein, partial [Pirellulales bacterium]